MSLKLPVYSELVKAFYSNLEIHEGTLMSEVYGAFYSNFVSILSFVFHSIWSVS